MSHLGPSMVNSTDVDVFHVLHNNAVMFAALNHTSWLQLGLSVSGLEGDNLLYIVSGS